MATSFKPLVIRQRLSQSYREKWSAPTEFGPDGWSYVLPGRRSVIVSCADQVDGTDWVHASVAGNEMPSYDELKRLHAAVFGDGYAYQVFAPSSDHVNIHEFALHLWGRLDGEPVLPEFAFAGSI